MGHSRLWCLLQAFSFILFATAAPASYEVLQSRAATTVPFTLNLTWANHSPVNGSSRYTILMNGTSPGPALHMNIGDTVNFLVHNNLPFATSVHFHGITQLKTPWADGVPGLSQKYIAPGASFLYTWTADEYGTYFYHAHERGQIMDGLFGAIIIAPSANEPRPFGMISSSASDLAAMQTAEQNAQTAFVSDWSQFTSKEFFDISIASGVDNYCMDAILVNGQGSVYCQTQDVINAETNPRLSTILAASNPSQLTLKGCLPANAPLVQGNFTYNFSAIPATAFDVCTPTSGPMTLFTVDPAAEWAAFNFINTGGISGLEISIDSHQMYVYAADGLYIQPQLVDALTVFNGERYSVMVKLNQQVGDYAMRIANTGLNQVISGFSVLSYKGSTGASSTASAWINYAGVNTTADFIPLVPSVIVPFKNSKPASYANATFILDIAKTTNAWKWTLGGNESMNATTLDSITPLLFNKSQPLANDKGLSIQTKLNQWVDLIIQVAGPLAQPHPIHKHSNKAYIIGSGLGPFNWTSVAAAQAAVPSAFNLVNPPLRDGFTTTPAEGNSSWMALRYQVINPGAFFLHCHVQTHLSGGMAMAILDGVDHWPTVPSAYLTNNGLPPAAKKTS